MIYIYIYNGDTHSQSDSRVSAALNQLTLKSLELLNLGPVTSFLYTSQIPPILYSLHLTTHCIRLTPSPKHHSLCLLP
uniref:Uncharacterized protein n=1 Tax=Octopus bimaculoides TaxID=37653 RepID=A0A0L8H1D2_OCTBM